VLGLLLSLLASRLCAGFGDSIGECLCILRLIEKEQQHATQENGVVPWPSWLLQMGKYVLNGC
jgi:hypothetical protein